MTSKLGHYDIVEELGRGGMGVVYKGYEPALGRYVAIKVLATAMAHDPVFVERFLREARAMAALSDPHIIQIYFIGQDEDQVFFAMEFIDGDSLSGWLKRDGKLGIGDALKILLQASQGLAAAHAEGVIHRDIKPGNIMINNRGVVKVADFGIALASNDISSSKLTSTGALVGTPGYLPPEVCLGKAVDQRSDIFALGIVLFETLTGRMPFNDASPLKLMLEIVESDIPDIREFNPDVDDETVRILGRMLEKNPSDRYQSCDELNADLMKHPQAIGPLSLKAKPVDQGDKATMIGLPTPGTGGHKPPPRGATPLPQVGARTQPLMSQPASGTFAPQTQAPGTAAPAVGATVQTGQVVAAPPAKSKALPIALVSLLVLGGVGFGAYKVFGPKPEPPADATTTAAAPGPGTSPVAPPAPPPAPAARVAKAGTATVASPTAANVAAGAHPAAESLQPATGAVAASGPTQAELDEMVQREVARHERIAAQEKAARDKKRAAAAAANSDTGEDETVSDDDSGGGGATDTRALRKAYLCRTQHRC
jgi:serine/threonine-protein kinase